MSLLCLRLRRKWSPHEGSTKRRSGARMTLAVTEDTPPDMLAGQMGLRLRLPQGNHVRMSVNRSTPMMDLLVQVTTAHKLSPAGHVLQPYGEAGLLPYKPSTPIGALDTWTVHVVPKIQSSHNGSSGKSSSKQSVQPFEQTYRIQVHLPRKQLYVTRVSGRTTLGQVLKQVCEEKNLDTSKYSFRHPRQLDQALSENLSIGEFRHNQLCLVSNRALPSPVSSEDIMAMQQYYPSRESSSRSLSPDSSMSPQPPQPSRPTRKRRPAPKPPSQPPAPKTEANNTLISHSRTSSDSSGYHEASVLSESPDSNNSLPDSLPRRSKLPGRDGEMSRSLGDLSGPPKALKPAQSTSALFQGRKKKPAPAPPVQKMSSVAEETKTVTDGSAEVGKEKPKETERTEEKSGSPLGSFAEVEPEKTEIRKAPQPKPRTSQISRQSLTPSDSQKASDEESKPEEGPETSAGARSETGVEEVDRESVEVVETVSEEGSGRRPSLRGRQHSEVDLKRLETRATMREVESTGDLARLAAAPPQPLHDKWPSVDDLTEESELIMADEEIDRIFNNATGEGSGEESGGGATPPTVAAPLPSPPPPASQDPLNWEYRLPAPPTFRDEPVERVALLRELREVVGRKLTAPRCASPQNHRASWTTDSTLSNFTIGTYQQGPLRKTSSEQSLINVASSAPEEKVEEVAQTEKNKKKVEFEKSVTGLQSLKVLRSILPHLSQSQGSVNTLGLAPPTEKISSANEKVVKGPDRPAVSVTTWGERPKRQVSIKSDRDYVFGKGQAEPDSRRGQPSREERAEVAARREESRMKPRRIEPTVRRESSLSSDLLRVIGHRETSLKDHQMPEEERTVSVKQRTEVLKRLERKDSETHGETPAPRNGVQNEVPLNGEVRIVVKREADSPRSPPEIKGVSEIVRSFKEQEKAVRLGREPSMNGRRDGETSESVKERRGQCVYRELDTGNTRPIKLRTTARLPVVRSVELKKPHLKPTYIFGTHDTQPPSKKYTSVVGIGGTESRVIAVRSPPPIKESRFQTDPRDELLESIRAFGGRANLRKVSSR